jgi:hypothetical protein
MAFIESTGSSSIEISRTSKGEYSYSIKLYFTGSAMTSINRVIKNISEAKEIMEDMIIRSKVSDPDEEIDPATILSRIKDSKKKADTPKEGNGKV